MLKHSWIAALCTAGLIMGCSHSATKPQPASSLPKESSKPAKPEGKAASAKAVTAAIDAWADAWSRRDVQAYLAAYARDFKPDKGTRSEWEKQRRERIGKAKSIKITVGTPQITSNGPDRATARFTQTYASDTLNDTTEKKLELRLVDGQWLITRETSL